MPFSDRQKFAALMSFSLAGLVWLINKFFARSSENYESDLFSLKNALKNPRIQKNPFEKSQRGLNLYSVTTTGACELVFVGFKRSERPRTLEKARFPDVTSSKR